MVGTSYRSYEGQMSSMWLLPLTLRRGVDEGLSETGILITQNRTRVLSSPTGRARFIYDNTPLTDRSLVSYDSFSNNIRSDALSSSSAIWRRYEHVVGRYSYLVWFSLQYINLRKLLPTLDINMRTSNNENKRNSNIIIIDNNEQSLAREMQSLSITDMLTLSNTTCPEDCPLCACTEKISTTSKTN